jgi:outer membrane protein insertion porin family
METRVGNFFSFLTSFGVFKETSFEADLERITAYYYNQGYINVKVDQPTLRLSRDKQSLFITIPISEGAQHFVDSVALTGDFLPDHPREALEPKMKLRVPPPPPGQEATPKVFSYGDMREDITYLKDLYQDKGYAYANVNPIPRIDARTQRVSLTYDIQKGPKVYFGRVEVIGNNKTRDKVVRRELLFAEGELFSATRIKLSKARVQRLGFFETVDITTSQGEQKGVVDVKVSVAERPTGTFQVGAGFSSVENFIAMAQISQNNLFGRGQSLSLQATLSSIRTLFNIRFSEPYLLDTNWQLSVDLYDFEFVFNDFTRSSTGGSLTLGYPLPRDWMDALGLWGDLSVAGTYKLEEVGVEAGGRNGTQRSSAAGLFNGGLTSSVQGSLFWDTRDNRLFPTSGFFQSASVEVADDLTLSENEFIRYSGESRWYFPVFWEFVLKFNLEAGVVLSTNPDKPVPIFERFFLGGPNSVRGFQRATLGPSREIAGSSGDPATSLSDFNIGGNKKLLLNAELEFPIFASVGIRGVFFFDVGNAFDDGKSVTFVPDLLADPRNDFADSLRTAWGLGFRWFSPIGAAALRVGLPAAPAAQRRPARLRVLHRQLLLSQPPRRGACDPVEVVASLEIR